ncbi:MAG: T9SS type A sorting domain-containing protein [Ignavibacteriaceae bacterium]|nr:T9SS type A sorting domain-containing protein [Ignavibacteriaceae bacterium]
MKNYITFLIFIFINIQMFSQDSLYDYIPPDTSGTSGGPTLKLTTSLSGNFHELVINITFPDRDTSYPQIVPSSGEYPLVGSWPDGTLLDDYVKIHGSFPADLWYGPGLQYFYSQQSGGLYNVNFTFPKTTLGYSYTTTHSFSYFQNLNGSDIGVVWDEWKLMADEVILKIYNENPSLFQGVNCLHLNFTGISSPEFHPLHGGTISWGATFRDSYNNIIYQGPVSYQRNMNMIAHERLHIIGKLSGSPNGFNGFPDRGEDTYLYNVPYGTEWHCNLSNDDIMYHNAPVVDQHSLYGILPLNSHDLMFLGWIKSDEILEINKDNFTSFDVLKLKDISYPLSTTEIADGYKRLIKVRVKNNYYSDLEEYFLIEYHAGVERNFQPNFSRAHTNYDDYPVHGWGNGIYIWHVREIFPNFDVFQDVMLNPKIACPYNLTPIQPDGLPPLQFYYNRTRDARWNGINSGENSYIDDCWRFPANVFKYLPDGGRNIWEIANLSHNVNHAWWPYPNPDPNNLYWPRRNTTSADFFTDESINGQVRNRMSDNTIPSTRSWGNYTGSMSEYPNKTHIAILDMARQSGNNYPNSAYMSLKVKYNYWEGEILTDETMSGNVTIGANVIVPAGKTLTISSGTTLSFAYGDSLKVNGVLNAVGTSTNPITFTSSDGNTADSWGAITFDGSGTSNLDHVIIKYGDGIQCLNNADVTIQNSRIDTCTEGIIVNSASPQILNDTIYNPANNGIWCHSTAFSTGRWLYIANNAVIKDASDELNYQTGLGIWIIGCDSPVIGTNIVKGFDRGIDNASGSCVFLATDSVKNNLVINNSIGVLADWGTTLFAGNEGDDFCVNNSIHDNTTNIWCKHESWTEAGYNYWGDGHRSITDGSEIDFYGDLATDPWFGQNLAVILPGSKPGLNSINKTTGSIGNSTDSLSIGFLLERQGRISEAITFYKNLISNDNHVRIALSHLTHIKNKYARNEIVDYFESLLTSNSKHYPKVEKILADISLYNNQFDNAMTAYDNVIQNDPAGYDGISARFEKLFAYLYIKKNPTMAAGILAEIKGLNSDDMEVEMLIKSVGNLLKNTELVGKNVNLTDINIPTTYNLYQNYPNPFNPTTAIQYQIPKPGIVTIKVYDILGREVATLVNENKVAGDYNFTFDASRFASGVYIYQLRVNDYVSSKKMILLK